MIWFPKSLIFPRNESHQVFFYNVRLIEFWIQMKHYQDDHVERKVCKFFIHPTRKDSGDSGVLGVLAIIFSWFNNQLFVLNDVLNVQHSQQLKILKSLNYRLV